MEKMNPNTNQIYTNAVYQSQLPESSSAEVVTNNNPRILQSTTSSNNHHHHHLRDGSLDLSNDYINNDNGIQIVNYIPSTTLSLQSELLHHQQYVQSMKKIDFYHPKDHHQQILQQMAYEDTPAVIVTSATSNLQQQQSNMPVLTPLKFVEFPNSSLAVDDQIIGLPNDDMSEKSDCEESISESNRIPSHKQMKRSLPHKKRIAKKLNSNDFNNDEQHYTSMPMDDASMHRVMQQQQQPVMPAPLQFECNLCGMPFLDQLGFFMHLKDHYEPMRHAKKKRHMRLSHEEEHEENLLHEEEQQQQQQQQQQLEDAAMPENLIMETLEVQQEIKTEEAGRLAVDVNDIDHFSNEFSEPEDMMEDLRKEVEKVVETIAESDCLPESSWNYQHDDMMPGTIQTTNEQLFPQQNLNQVIEDNSYPNEILPEQQSNDENDDDFQTMQNNSDLSNDEDDDDDEDNKPLEAVRQSLKKSVQRSNQRQFATSVDDKEDQELTECLKKIHNFKCLEPDCGKAFNSRTALGYHIKTHTPERRYVCDQCGKKFLTNGALKVHLRLHSDDRPYKCNFPQCDKAFRQWGDLKYHETSLHSNVRDHVCEYCAKAFARRYSLVIHRRIHTGEKNYKCDHCTKTFRASSYLLNHRRIHTGEKPYSCSYCMKKFRVQGDLKRHMKIHERVKPSNAPVLKKKSAPNVKNIKIEPVVKPVINEIKPPELINDECVDLSIKDDKSLIYSSNQIDMYKKGAKTVESSKEETKLVVKKERKSSRKKKGK